MPDDDDAVELGADEVRALHVIGGRMLAVRVPHGKARTKVAPEDLGDLITGEPCGCSSVLDAWPVTVDFAVCDEARGNAP